MFETANVGQATAYCSVVRKCWAVTVSEIVPLLMQYDGCKYVHIM